MLPELHPLAQKYPPMEADEFAAFTADLAEHGQKNPIWLFEGKILDGRNRLRACTELGIDPVYAEFTGTEAEAVAFVDSQNLHRRHLNKEWRQQRVREMRDQGMSCRTIARKLGVSAKTVSVDANSGVTSVTPEPSKHESLPVVASVTPQPPMQPTPTREPPRVKGRDGKSYPAKLPASTKPKPVRQMKAPPPTTAKTKPAPKEKAQWAELATILGELAQKVETLVPTPEENEKPWELISSLETTAASLLRQAERLRRRHHL